MRIAVHALSAALGAAFIAASVTVSTADPINVRIVSGMPPATAQTQGVQRFAERLEELTDGEITTRTFLGSLLSLTETLGGLRDGVVDFGFTVIVYHRGEFPHLNLLSDLAVVGEDPVVLTAAASEYMFQCSECIEEMVAQNQIMMGTGANPTYQLMSSAPIATPEDFQGKRIRSFSSTGRWVEGFGGQMVTLPAGDIYEAMSQGQLDGNMHPAEFLKSMSFHDHMRYLLDMGIGSYIGNSYVTVNLDVWRDLSDEHKQAVLRASGDALAFTAVEVAKRNGEVVQSLQELGVTLIEPSAELRQATERFMSEDVATIARLNASEYGIHDAAERAEVFIGLVDKWEKLLMGVDSEEAVAELYWDEIYSKVDLALFD